MAVQSNGSLPLTPKIDISAAHTADVEEKPGQSKRSTPSKEGRHRKSEASRKRKKRTPAGRTRSAADEAPEAAGHRSRDRTISVEVAPTRRPSSAREASTSGGGGGGSPGSDGGGGTCTDDSSDSGDGGGRNRGSTGGTSNGSRGALGFLSLIPTEYHAPPPSQKLRHTTALSAVMLESDTISHDSDVSSVSETDAPLSPAREPEPQPDLSQGLTFGFMSAEGGKQSAADDADCLQPESGEFDPQMAGEGWLKRRVKAGKWKDVWCSLNFNGILKEHKDDDSDEATKTIKVSLCSISKDALTRHAFRLKIKSKTMIYQAPDSEAFAMWLPSLSVSAAPSRSLRSTPDVAAAIYARDVHHAGDRVAFVPYDRLQPAVHHGARKPRGGAATGLPDEGDGWSPPLLPRGGAP